MSKKCILIGAGEMKEENISLQKNDFVIAVDGGYQYCLKLHIRPQLVVGDFDSYPHSISHVEVLRSQPEKDDTDMMLAIQAGLERGYDEFVMYGAMGGRFDIHRKYSVLELFMSEKGPWGVGFSKQPCRSAL